ncbi:hypothetical protein ES703_21565 [subsurface metagenome]
MKKLRGKRFLGVPLAIPLVFVLIAVLTVGVVLALAIRTIPSTVTIIDDYGIEVWSAVTGGSEVTAIPWGDVQEGDAPVQSVWIRNVGTATATVTVTTVDLPGAMTLTLTGGSVEVAVGDTRIEAELTLDTGTVITDGSERSFSIIFTNTP